MAGLAVSKSIDSTIFLLLFAALMQFVILDPNHPFRVFHHLLYHANFEHASNALATLAFKSTIFLLFAALMQFVTLDPNHPFKVFHHLLYHANFEHAPNALAIFDFKAVSYPESCKLTILLATSVFILVFNSDNILLQFSLNNFSLPAKFKFSSLSC